MSLFLEKIDKRHLESILQSFSFATGMTAYACDRVEITTKIFGANKIIETLVKANEEAALEEGVNSFSSGKANLFRCPTGLAEFCAPVVVDGDHIGSIFAGQIMISGEEPDAELSQEVAGELGLDFDEYCSMLGKLPALNINQAKAYSELLKNIAAGISATGKKEEAAPPPVQKIVPTKTVEIHADLNYKKAKEIVEAVNKNSLLLLEEFTAIKEKTHGSVETVEKTDTIIKYIQNITTQMTLLGFNASIEAKRVGAAGDGFNVIAQEVRKLAQQTSSQTQSIESVLNDIKTSINNINSELSIAAENLNKDVKAIASLKGVIDEAVENQND